MSYYIIRDCKILEKDFWKISHTLQLKAFLVLNANPGVIYMPNFRESANGGIALSQNQLNQFLWNK